MSSQNKMHVKTGDLVVVVSGKNNYRNAKKNGNIKAIGKVLQTSPKEGKVIVEGVNLVKKHVKPRKQGEAGGIVEAEGAMYASKVMLYCPKCQKGVRVSHKVSETGEKIRVCKTPGCGEIL